MELGYGTDYEVFILKGIAKRLQQKYKIASTLEFPKNNLLGNAVVFSGQSKKDQPDLVWNFCEFENQKNSESFFQKLNKFNSKYLLIITQNHYNPGVLIHLIYHFLLKSKWNHGDFKKMSYLSVLSDLAEISNFEVVEIGAFDVPWFILDVYETGKYFRSLPLLKGGIKKISISRFENLPLFLKYFLGHHHFVLLKRKC